MSFLIKGLEHQKENGNGHKQELYNYTAFLAKDRDVGSARVHRPDILFQIRTPQLRSVKPDGYVKYNGRIIFDPFDHGLQGSMILGRAERRSGYAFSQKTEGKMDMSTQTFSLLLMQDFRKHLCFN